MVFSSVIFLCYFLPVVMGVALALQFFVNRNGGRGLPLVCANAWLLLASLAFYAWGELRLLWVMLLSGALSYVGGLLVDKAAGKSRQIVLAATIGAILALLLWFKYAGFAAELLRRFHVDARWGSVALPLGISFFTFHSISYVVDVYRRKVAPTRNLIDYGCYFVLFPQLVAGPIVRFSEVAESYVRRVTTFEDVSEGGRRFIYGLGKKVLIANQVSLLADAAFSLPDTAVTGGSAWLGTIAYALQIYFDFSGYSDMALGLGRMLGFTFPENFDAPYTARSVREFWRRWHMTLSRFFRDYVYIPLGGNRHGAARTALNLVIVFALCGLWHGASLTFLAWGLLHGAFLALERVAEPAVSRLPAWTRPFGHVYTLGVVLAAWVLFRADTWTSAQAHLAAMVNVSTFAQISALPWRALAPDVLLALVAGLALCANSGRGQPASDRPLAGLVLPPLQTVWALGILVACLLSVGAGSHNPFIYFRF